MIYGIDEVGRAECVGPLVIGVAGAEDMKRKSNYEDSKNLSLSEIDKYSSLVEEEFEYYGMFPIFPKTISSEMKNKSLNEIERDKIFDVLNDKVERNDEVIIDQIRGVDFPFDYKMEQKADQKYDIVSASSIIAKYARNRYMRLLTKEKGDLTFSCKPNATTYQRAIDGLVKKNDFPHYIRGSWSLFSQLREKWPNDLDGEDRIKVQMEYSTGNKFVLDVKLNSEGVKDVEIIY